MGSLDSYGEGTQNFCLVEISSLLDSFFKACENLIQFFEEDEQEWMTMIFNLFSPGERFVRTMDDDGLIYESPSCLITIERPNIICPRMTIEQKPGSRENLII